MVSVTDPVTGQVKTATLLGGETARAAAYPQDHAGDKCDIIQDRFGAGDIEGFVLVELVDDPGLCEKIYEDSGIDVLGELAGVQERLARDQRDMKNRLDSIDSQLSGQENNVSTDPVWDEGGSGGGSGSGGSGGGGGSSGGSSARIVTLKMPQTAAQVQAELNKSSVKGVILKPDQEIPENNILHVDIPMTVSTGKSLTFSDGVDAYVQEGSTLTVDGAMTGTGSLWNDGQVEVNSSNTLEMGYIYNYGIITNTEKGRIVAAKRLATENYLDNRGIIEGVVLVDGGQFIMRSGEITSSGSSEFNSTVVTSAGAFLMLEGGTITNTSASGYALTYEGDINDAAFSGTVLRSKRAEIVAFGSGDLSFVPAGYIKTDRAESDGYYYLRPDFDNPASGTCGSLTDVYYGGSESQWKAISVSTTGNADLTGASIHYGSEDNPGTVVGPFTVKGGVEGNDYIYIDGELTIMTNTPLTISNTGSGTTTSRIAVSMDNAAGARITLNGVRIDASGTSGAAEFLIPYDYTHSVTVTLAGGSENVLTSGASCAGLQKSGIGTLTSDGPGRLTATGGYGGAGIGGGDGGDGTNIEINSGIVTAIGKDGGAGIGGGNGGSGTDITISSVTITNKGTSPVVKAEQTSTTIEKASFRSKGESFFVDNDDVAWTPEGYIATEEPDEDGYYVLSEA